MRKGFLILVVFLLVGVLGLNGKKISHLIVAKPETKTVRFSVFTGTDYSKPLYRKSNAKILLTICKFNSNGQQVIWEGVIDRGSLKNYPTASSPIFKEVSVYNVFDRHETIAAYYKVLYDYKGSKLYYEDGISLSTGSTSDSLSIKI